MAEYLLRPKHYNYYSNYQNASASYPTPNAFDNDTTTYWIYNNNTSSYDKYRRTLYGFNIEDIPNTEIITHIKLRVMYYASSTSKPLKITPVTKYATVNLPISDYQLGGTITFPVTSASTILTNSSDDISQVVDYLNNNKSGIITGEKSFGLFVEFDSWSNTRIYDICLIAETRFAGSLIYNGSNNITSAYLGSTKLNGIYLGSQKLL